MKASNAVLSLEPYKELLDRVETQFGLLRFSLKSLKRRDYNQFWDLVGSKQVAQFEKTCSILKKHLNDQKQPKPIVDSLVDSFDSIKRDALANVKRAKRAGSLRATAEFTEDRLNQSELLLLVAHFESFMKVVHERFLHAAPAKVFGKGFRDTQNAKIALEDIFPSGQSGWNPDKFLSELIAKEVKWLDSQSIPTKADYFNKRLGISFGPPEEIENLKQIMELRNQISHEIYEHPKNHEEMLKETLGQGIQPPLVSAPTLERARQLFYLIPRKCIEHGAKSYPYQFKV